MTLDPRVARSVAWPLAVGALALAGCPPRTTPPEAPGTEPTPPQVDHRRPPSTAGQSAMLGELCPTAADGRPGIAPLAARAVTWTTRGEELAARLARGRTGAFAVLGHDGRRVGVFNAIGVSDQGPAPVAIGSYAGSGACSRPTAAGAAPADDPLCVAATGQCGLAVASMSTGGDFDSLEPPEVVTGGACASGDSLVVDLDGDGSPEAFPLAGFLDGSRAPAEELTATTSAPAACTPHFSRYGLAIAVDAAIADPRHRVTVDILGVLDVDGDDRRELIVGLRYAERRTIAIYSAIDSPARLTLVGEVEPWPKP